MKSAVGGWLGRWQYLRGKSAIYVEAARSWIMPASAVGAYALYLGVGRRWSVAIALLVPVLGETVGYFLGRFLFNHGGVEAEYQMALDRDPYKRESLAELARIREVLTRGGQGEGDVLTWTMMKKIPPPPEKGVDKPSTVG